MEIEKNVPEVRKKKRKRGGGAVSSEARIFSPFSPFSFPPHRSLVKTERKRKWAKKKRRKGGGKRKLPLHPLTLLFFNAPKLSRGGLMGTQPSLFHFQLAGTLLGSVGEEEGEGRGAFRRPPLPPLAPAGEGGGVQYYSSTYVCGSLLASSSSSSGARPIAVWEIEKRPWLHAFPPSSPSNRTAAFAMLVLPCMP